MQVARAQSSFQSSKTSAVCGGSPQSVSVSELSCRCFIYLVSTTVSEKLAVPEKVAILAEVEMPDEKHLEHCQGELVCRGTKCICQPLMPTLKKRRPVS